MSTPTVSKDDIAQKWMTYSLLNGGKISERITICLRYPRRLLRELKVLLGTVDPSEVQEPYPVVDGDAFIPPSIRDGHRMQQLRKCSLTYIASDTSVDGLWTATLTLAEDKASAKHARVIILLSCNLANSTHCITFIGTAGASFSTDRPYIMKPATYLPLLGHEVGRPNHVQPELLVLNDVHHTTVLELDLKIFIKYLEWLSRPSSPVYFLHVDVKGQLTVTPRLNLSSLGVALQTKPDLVAELLEVGQLSMRDVQSLALACKAMQLSLARETERRLRIVLSPYFPDVSGLAQELKNHGALISGSTILSVLVPGEWRPGDLDIVLPKSSRSSFECFLTSNGYSFDKKREDILHLTYPPWQVVQTPSAFEYHCFFKDENKIDLCYVDEPFLPLDHILTYHSTAVMNLFDGKAVYCIFPEQTFAHEYILNRQSMSSASRLAASLQKLESRGFVAKFGGIHDWYSECYDAQERRIIFHSLPAIWGQTVNL